MRLLLTLRLNKFSNTLSVHKIQCVTHLQVRWGDDIFDPLTSNMSGRIFVQIQAVTYLKWKISLPTIFMTQFLKGTMIDLVHSVVGKKRLKTKVSRSCATLNLF